MPAATTATAFGEIQRSGGSATTGTGTGARCLGGPPGQVGGDLPAACRPDSAATSAVSAACTRLPAANTPGADVAMVVSIAGPSVPASSAMPAVRASTWSGIQSPVNTSHSQATVRGGPAGRSAGHASTAASRPSAPVTRVTAVDVQTGTRQRSAAPSRKAA